MKALVSCQGSQDFRLLWILGKERVLLLRSKKIQQRFLHEASDTKIIVQGCQVNQNLRGQDPREKQGASPHLHSLSTCFFSVGAKSWCRVKG